jgi:hypothetical protein
MMTVNKSVFNNFFSKYDLFTFINLFTVNNLLPEQLKSENKKWTDLALDFLNDEPQQLQNQNPQQSQQIQ